MDNCYLHGPGLRSDDPADPNGPPPRGGDIAVISLLYMGRGAKFCQSSSYSGHRLSGGVGVCLFFLLCVLLMSFAWAQQSPGEEDAAIKELVRQLLSNNSVDERLGAI